MAHDRHDGLLIYPVELFYYCYRTIENFLTKTFWYCLCNLYQVCQIERGHLQGAREYCCVCQIANDYSIDRLMAVKNDIFKLTEMYIQLLEVEFKFRDRHCKEARSYLRDSIEFLYGL